MSYWLFVVAGAFVVYALVSRRLSTTAITGPMVFVTVGFIIGTNGFEIVDIEANSEAVTTLLEITLLVVLFSDAYAINSTAWRTETFVPGRLLLVGMPLTIALGIGTAVILFTDLGFWEAALIAAILAPTDASLGQAVISNPRVPQRIRQGLNVESGLNDGVVLPLVLVFLGAAEESATSGSIGGVLSFIGEEVLIAVVVGIAVGWTGAKAILAASRRGLMSPMWTQIGALALAAAAYGLATPLHGSGFIAAWLTGLVVGALTRGRVGELTELSESLGAYAEQPPPGRKPALTRPDDPRDPLLTQRGFVPGRVARPEGRSDVCALEESFNVVDRPPEAVSAHFASRDADGSVRRSRVVPATPFGNSRPPVGSRV